MIHKHTHSFLLLFPGYLGNDFFFHFVPLIRSFVLSVFMSLFYFHLFICLFTRWFVCLSVCASGPPPGPLLQSVGVAGSLVNCSSGLPCLGAGHPSWVLKNLTAEVTVPRCKLQSEYMRLKKS